MAISNFTIAGRVTADAVIKYSSGGIAIVNFTIANNYTVKGVKNSNFFNCEMYGKFGESVAQYLTKGQSLTVGGEMRQQKWQTDGQNRSKIAFIVSSLELQGKNNSSVNNGNNISDLDVNTFTDDEIPF